MQLGPQKEKEENRAVEIFEDIMTNYLNERQQTTDPRSSENLVITCDATFDTSHDYGTFNNVG